MKPFRALDLAIEFHKLAITQKVHGHLKDQLLRAAASIPLNLAEGNAKFSVKEKKRFYLTAYGSLKECQTIFKMMEMKEGEIINKADHLGALIYKLVQSNITQIIKTEKKNY